MILHRDLLGQIANARAQLMLRGLEDLQVIIGTVTMDLLKKQAYPYAPYEDQILGMPFQVCADLEGFVVMPCTLHDRMLYAVQTMTSRIVNSP